MKFTKEQAVEKLNQILTNNGKKTLRMSERTLSAHTESLMNLIADDEMELDAFVDKVKGQLESVNSNMEKDHSDFVKDYEAKHKKTEPDPKQEPDPKKDDPNKELLERLAKLEQAEKDRLAAASLATKRSEIRAYLEKNNVKNSEWIDKILAMANITAEDNSEEKGKELLGLYIDGNRHKPIVPGGPSGGGDDDVKFDDVAAILKQRNGGE